MIDKRFHHSLHVKPKKLNILPPNPEEIDLNRAVGSGRFPSWLHRKLPHGTELAATERALGTKRLHTVCEEAKCPNMMECWSHKTATFLIMGKECTRSCGFCDIAHSKLPLPLEADEPERVAESVFELGLKHVVITMVARDDLIDGGASHLAKTIEAVRKKNPSATIEVLASDLEGKKDSLDILFSAKPEIFNHNIETVQRLTPRVRHKATYERTLEVLAYAKQKGGGMLIKSGLMVGLGEEGDEVKATLADLKKVGCDIVTIGQYLQASRLKLIVKEFIPPALFDQYAVWGKNLGISNVYSGPFVRSSYNAGLVFEEAGGIKREINSI